MPQRYFLELRFDDIWGVDMKYDIFCHCNWIINTCSFHLAYHISVSCNGIILIGYIILLCFVSLEFSIALWNESSWFYGIKPKQRNRNKSLNALEVIGHTESSLRVSVYVILIFFIERNEIYYYEQLHKRANTISIRFIDTGKIYRRKRMWKEFQHFVR